MVEISNTRALFLGRFQPYHLGHESVIRKIAAEVSEIIIAVGSAQYSHTAKDPFTAGERITMITRSLSDLGITTYVLPVEDIEQNALYVAHIKRLTPRFDVVYTNNSLVIQLFDEAGIAVKRAPFVDRGELWGTKIRELMVSGGDWQSLVPTSVCEVIEEIDGVARMKLLRESDVHNPEISGSGAPDPKGGRS